MATTANSRNPFRSQNVTPVPTGALNAAPTSPPPQTSPTSPAQTTSPPLPPRPSRQESSSSDGGLLVEAPPAYTPAADVYQGEATLEMGPNRPFQPAPQQPPPPSQQLHPYLSPQSSGWSQPWPQQQYAAPNYPPRPSSAGPPIGSWSAYPGQVSSLPSNSLFHPPPPINAYAPANGTTPQPTSDFARDFYAAGPSDPSELGSSQTSYTPPPGLPPSRSATMYNPPPGRPPPSSSDIPDDGRPTTKPVPGHPLLLNGKMLVYPPGFECRKCNNTGFKFNDPSHPCRTCWDRYARSYSGALAYAPSQTPSSTSPTSTGPKTNFQRPLRHFRPPQARSDSGHHSRSLSQSSSAPQITLTDPYHPPPPDAIVLPPGDPRIGGRLCWKCGGQGVVSYFLFDETQCPACSGVGRVFV